MQKFKTLLIAASALLFSSDVLAKKSTDLTVQHIEITGNTKTKESVILRELSFSLYDVIRGSEFKQIHIPRSVANLKNLDLFNEINIALDSIKPNGSVTVKIKVTEKWYLWPLPFIEFSDRNFNQWYSLDLEPYRTNYGLYLFKNNLWGLNHTAKFTFGRGYTNTTAFQYIAPYIDKNKRLGFNLDVRKKTRREMQYDVVENKEQFFRDFDQVLITNQSASLSLHYRRKLYVKHSIVGMVSNTQLADTILSETLNPNYLFNGNSEQRLAQFSYGLTYNKTDNEFLPTTGVFSNSLIRYTHFLGNQTGYITIRSQAGLYKTLKGGGETRERFGAGIHGVAQWTSMTDLPFNHSRALGYDHYVRSFENNVILGTDFVIIKYELRYQVIKNKVFHLRYMPIKPYKNMPTSSFLSLFLDHGYTHYRNQRQSLVGYGIGLNSMFYYDKVVRFEYSWNTLGNSGLKLHFKKAF